ncbi:MAG: hypothetical protein OQJ89_08510 [Kangiellaceae bacterium]|nr:hypothetical protein [Kangiellaceae bacterium]MCW9016991.1 hypothetical protein [Kangiellaceae bacterium]
MNGQTSEKLFTNLVVEKHEIYKASLSSLLSALSDNDQKLKLNENSKLLDSSNDLAKILVVSDRPGWLNNTLIFTQEYKNKNKTPDSVVSGSSWQLLQAAMKIYDQAMNHNWTFTNQGNEKKYDFDNVYKKYRDESDLVNLFDSMIDTLNSMISSGEIDSIKATSALNELVSTLRQNRNSSYFSTMTSWEFIKGFTKNYTWEQIKSIPGVKSFKNAFEKTMSDMDMELDKLHQDIADEIKNKYQVKGQSSLSYKGNHKLMLDAKSESN